MASYELSAFDRFSAITVVGAIEQQTPATINVGFGFVTQISFNLSRSRRSTSSPRLLWEQTF